MNILDKIEDPILIFAFDKNNLIKVVEANNKTCFLLKYTKEELKETRTEDIIAKEDFCKINYLIEILNKKSSFIYELHFCDKEGSVLLFNLDLHLTRYEGKNVIFAIAKNSTEIEPIDSYLRFAKVIENTDAAVLTLDLDDNIKTANKSSCEMLGINSDKLAGLKVLHFIKPFERNKFIEMKSKIFKGQKLSRLEIACMDSRRREIYLALTLSPIKDINEEIRGYSIIARDISERVGAERQLEQSRLQLRELARHINEVREEERKSIAADVHDVLGQNLTALKLDTLWLKKKFNNDDPAYMERLDDMYSLIEITAEHIHKISAQLRPPGLDHLGLIPAIEYQLQEVKKRTGINFHFVCEPSSMILPEPFATPMFRIFQELMTNIMRHSKARNVDVNISKNDKMIIMKVRDDGIGMTQEKINNSKAFGILGMRERALSIGGTIEILSNLNLGTSITVMVNPEQSK